MTILFCEANIIDVIEKEFGVTNQEQATGMGYDLNYSDKNDTDNICGYRVDPDTRKCYSCQSELKK